MKKIVFTLLALTALLAIGVKSASAQVIDGLEFNVPFDFTVADKSFPAGTYIVSPLGNYSEGVFALRDLDSKRESIFMVENSEKATIPNKSELIFEKVGDHYFLSEIYEAGNATGERLPETRLEKRLMKAEAKEQGIAQLVVVFSDMMKAEGVN